MENLKLKIQHKEPITLVDIRSQKEIVLKEIRVQQKKVSDRTEGIISPIADTGSTLMNSFNVGMMAFDTVMMGIRAFRKIGRLFRRRR